MATIYNSRILGFQNNSKDLICRVYDASNNSYDLSGYNAYLYAQKYPPQQNNPLDVSIAATSIDASSGSILFSLTQSDLNLTPGDYVYEVIIDNGAGIVLTVVQDRLQIRDSIVS